MSYRDRSCCYRSGHTSRSRASPARSAYELACQRGFTDPKWKGRIGLEATDSEWMATLIKTSPGNTGTDLVRKIAALQPALRKGHDQVGESLERSVRQAMR